MTGMRIIRTASLSVVAALALALPVGGVFAQERTEAASAASFSGAGSTFAHPVLLGWSRAFQRTEWTAESQSVGSALDYEPVGSQAGIMRLNDGAVDFAATDVPLSPDELSRYRVGQFPFVIGGIVVAHNLEGVPAGKLRLSGEVLADVFLGTIRSWNDERIRVANPELRLPPTPITVVRRSDGSGTTFNFTSYLAKLSPEWKTRVGEGFTVAWPLGDSAQGNDGVAERIKATQNAIGYLDFAQAQKAGLAVVALRSEAGDFVVPSRAAFQAASGAESERRNAYPLIATTYAVMPRQTAPSRRQQAIIGFFAWSFANGARLASDLGYVPLPEAAIDENRAYWASHLGVNTAPAEGPRRTGRR